MSPTFALLDRLGELLWLTPTMQPLNPAPDVSQKGWGKYKVGMRKRRQ